MAVLRRLDGAEIQWHQRGEGPLVIIAGFFNVPPRRLSGLLDDLARDHRVVTYDPRGVGESSPDGPYDPDTDADDLEAVVAEADSAAVAVGLGDGCNRAIRVAARRPDLAPAVVVSGSPALSVEHARGTEALAASPAVLKALVKMLETDHRAALRQIFDSADPQTTDEAHQRERVDESVAYCSHAVAVARMRAWIADDAGEAGRALGDRLWILHYEGNPWFPEALIGRIYELLPDARLEAVADGAMSRPDLTASVVRRITQAAGEPPVGR